MTRATPVTSPASVNTINQRASIAPNGARLVSRNGDVLMEITSMDLAGRRLQFRGSLMGAIPTNILLSPEDTWKLLRLTSWKVAVALPLLLARGWWLTRKTHGSPAV